MGQYITEQEYRLLKRIQKRSISADKLSVKDLEALIHLIELGCVKDRSAENVEQGADNIRKILNQKAEEESCRRHKHRRYRNLVFKALLAFGLGLLLMYLLKLC